MFERWHLERLEGDAVSLVNGKRAKHAAYMRAYRQRNLEAMRVYGRSQHQKHKVRKLAYMAQYRVKNAEAVKAAKRRCYENKKAEYLSKCKEYYRKNFKQHHAVAKKWREANRERKREMDHNYYRANKQRLLELSGLWVEKHPEKKREYQRRYYHKHKTEIAARNNLWLEKNRAWVNERERNRHKAQPELRHAKKHKRRASERNAPGVATPEQIRARIEAFGGLCAYCRKRPYEHLDHVVPLSRGGSNWPANLRPACARCNKSKGKKKLSEWRPAA